MPDLLLRHLTHVGIGVIQQFPVFSQLPIKLAVAAEQGNHLTQIRVGLGEFAVTLLILVSVRRGQLFFQLHVAFFQTFQLGEHGHSLHDLDLEGGFPPGYSRTV